MVTKERPPVKNEGNELIAKFMGLYPIETHKGYFQLKNHRGKTHYHKDNIDRCYDICKFHSSWDWLMPVVEKIEKLGYYTKISGCASGICHYCWFNEGGDEHKPYQIIIGYNGENQESKIYVVWRACIEFIKWYNGQKQY